MSPKITNINIKNLRGLQDITLKDTRMFNLIVGPSEIGKTTVLEGIFIASHTPHMPRLININGFRGADIKSGNESANEAVSSLFYKWSAEKNIEIAADIKNIKNKKNRCASKFFLDTSDDNTKSYQLGEEAKNYKINANTVITGDIKGKIEQSLEITPAGVEVKLSKYDIKEKSGSKLKPEYVDTLFPAVRFIRSSDIITAINEIIKHKKQEDVIQVLKKINPDIEGFAILADNQPYIDIGLPQMVPMYIVGGGVQSVIVTLGNIYNDDTNVLIEDEIGSGIYYASLKKYLRAVLRFAKEQGKQIFATTHSKDVLIALKAVAEKDKEMQEDVMCYVLSRNIDDIVSAYPYHYETVEHCIKNRIEIR